MSARQKGLGIGCVAEARDMFDLTVMIKNGVVIEMVTSGRRMEMNTRSLSISFTKIRWFSLRHRSQPEGHA